MQQKKVDATKSAEHLREQYEMKALDFSKRISTELDYILEKTREVQRINLDTQAAINEEHEKRQAFEAAKTTAILEKSEAFHESVHRAAFEVQAWIEDTLVATEAHHARISEIEGRFRSKLDALKKDTPEEHLKKADSHRDTLDRLADMQEVVIKGAKDRLSRMHADVDLRRKGTKDFLEDMCGKMGRAQEMGKRDIIGKMDHKKNAMIAALTTLAVNLRLDQVENA